MPWTASVGAISRGSDVQVRVDYTNGVRTISETYVNPSAADFPTTITARLTHFQTVDDFIASVSVGQVIAPVIEATPVVAVPLTPTLPDPTTLEAAVDAVVVNSVADPAAQQSLVSKIRALFGR